MGITKVQVDWWEILGRNDFWVLSGGFQHCNGTGNTASSVYEGAASPAVTIPCFEMCLILAVATLMGNYRIIIAVSVEQGGGTGDAFLNSSTVTVQINHNH